MLVNKRIFKTLLSLFCISLLACSPAPRQVKQSHFPVDSPYSDKQLSRLFDRQLLFWEGVPYRNGGLSRQGIDCSGFVYQTYRDKINMIIPRTTAALSRTGESVKRGDLDVGDLVFFKTGNKKSRHVGIYVGSGEFIHASTSKGVIKSSLRNRYWRKAYWKATRLLD